MASPHHRRALKLYRDIDVQLDVQAKRLGAPRRAACCYLLVGITYAQARVIAEKLASSLDSQELCDLRGRLVEATGSLERLPCRDDYLLRQVPCVFLRIGSEPWSGTCTIFDVRPLACRLHLVVSSPERCAPDEIRNVAIVDTRAAHVQACLQLADPADERAAKYGPLAPLTGLALDEVLDGTVPSLLDLESWERKMERWGDRQRARGLSSS